MRPWFLFILSRYWLAISCIKYVSNYNLLTDDVKKKMTVYRLKTKEMFFHGVKSYMDFGYPKDELASLSCAGIDVIK